MFQSQYRAEEPEGLKHRSAGRSSNRAQPKKLRARVLRLVRSKYSGGEAETLRRWIENHGALLALYTDWKTDSVEEPTEQQLLRGEVTTTQFGRMCERLVIRITAAHSLRVKRRVERNHGTHQYRLVKKLRRKKIKTYEEANEFLEQEYLPEHNRRFACEPRAAEDYHQAKPSRKELDEVVRLETEPVIGNDWVVRDENRYLQVKQAGRTGR